MNLWHLKIFLKKNSTTRLKILLHWNKNVYKKLKYSKKKTWIFQIFVFCLPGSNPLIERVFSLMNTTWTDVRNQMDMKTVESCLITKMYGLSCMEFHDEILKKTFVYDECPQYTKVYEKRRKKFKISSY